MGEYLLVLCFLLEVTGCRIWRW